MPCALWKGLVGWAEIESESLVPACTSSSSQRNSHLLREIHVCVEGDERGVLGESAGDCSVLGDSAGDCSVLGR